jgi:hypothetical protein
MTLRFGPPLRRITHLLDIAAHAQTGARPPVVWRQLAGSTRTSAPAPAFLFGGADARMARHIYGQIDLPAAGCFSAEDAAIGPGGVIIKDGIGFHGDALGIPGARAAAILERLNARPTTTGLAQNPAASLFGTDNDAAALLTDVMPGLWVLNAAGHRGTLHIPIPADAHQDTSPLLLAAGHSASQLLLGDAIDAVLRAPRVLAPARLRHGARFSPRMGEATRFWTEKLRANLGLPPPEPRRALFISPRDTVEPTGVADWQHIEAAAIARGLAAIHPENLSLAERATTYGEADCLLGFDGAALLEACIFAPPGTPICAIRGNIATDLRLPGLAAALGHRPGLVFGRIDPENPEAPASVSGGDVQRAMTALLLLKEAVLF